MKIGINTSTLESDGYDRYGDQVYQKLKEQGYDAADVSLAQTGHRVYKVTQKEAEEILIRERKLAEQAGILISQVHGPWRWPARDATEEDRAERLESMKRSICFTSILGCQNWVVHPIMPFGTNELDTPDADRTWEMNVIFMRELLAHAKKYDVTICLENMPMRGFSLAKPKDILRLVREIDDPHFKICLDTGHVAAFNGAVNLAEEVRRLGSEIRILHVHDSRNGQDLHMMPGYGILDWQEFILALKEIRYPGVFSLETKPSPKLSNDAFEKMSRLLNQIAREIIA